MEDRKEKNGPWLSVPQFGDWDQKAGPLPDYSMDFTKIREMRKQNKTDISRASLGNEEELMASSKAENTNNNNHHLPRCHENDPSPSTRRSIFSCFNCCVKA